MATPTSHGREPMPPAPKSYTAGTLHDLFRKDNRDLKNYHVDYALLALWKGGLIERNKVGPVFIYPETAIAILRQRLERMGHIPRQTA